QNDTVDVIVPLATALPKNAGVRKYSTAGGWKAFSTDATDRVVSTTGSAGSCPASTATAWGNSLDEGDHCIRISITDGGENDTDGLANGVINFTGTIAGYEGINDDLVEGCSLSSQPKNLNEHGEWFILTAFIAWLGLTGYRKKQMAESFQD
ncbi:MAG: hypothetical protein OEZ38_14960, partial [Gammaproteobacteria bacterium]|nr:hypothetical protein [Gammaproteobacteria bacterium]